MKNKTARINNKYSFKDFLNNAFMIVFIAFIIHFALVFPFSNSSPSRYDKPFEKRYIVKTIIFSAPFQIYYIINQYKKHKNNKLNSTYLTVDGISYYRDKFKDISPATISLLVNLSLEEEKDIKTMLLYYEKQKIIKIENDKVVITSKNETLKDSDKKLLTYLNDRTLDNYNIWQDSIIKEAVDQKYIQRKDDTTVKKLLLKRKITMIALGITSFISYCCYNLQLTFSNINITKASEILERFPIVLSYTTMLFSTFALIVLIVKGKGSIFSNGNSIYIRTSKGNKLTEQIHALKRFIHDFSTLEEATKKELVLWEDFLIYATILEENTQIIEEITAYQKL